MPSRYSSNFTTYLTDSAWEVDEYEFKEARAANRPGDKTEVAGFHGFGVGGVFGRTIMKKVWYEGFTQECGRYQAGRPWRK